MKCELLKRAGVSDYDSQEGHLICLSCPYSRCVEENRRDVIAKERKILALYWHGQGLAAKEIAIKLKVCPSSVTGYLREAKHKQLSC